MNLIVKTIILMIASLFLGKSAVLACDCAMVGKPSQELERSKAVFIGKVIGLRDTGTYIEATIAVEKSWKGILMKQIVISTPRFGTTCRFWFEEGKEYLVYASSYEDGKGWTSACSRTRRLADANKDIRELLKNHVQK